jgi:regulator of protease activity HflC (stomatin/prohibitin superfamily)
MENKAGCLMTVGGILGVLITLSVILSMFIIPAGSVGVITRFGAVNRVAYSGFGFKIPFAEGVQKMNIRTQKDEADASAASKDLQVVSSKIAVNYHLDGASAVDVYREVGPDYVSIVIAPAIQNVFKGTTAQYTAEQLIQLREEVRLTAEQKLQKELLPYHIVVENFNIINFDFSPEFNAAIEKKQVAQQDVETAKQRLAQAQVDAQTALAVAKGQADAQNAIKSTGALDESYLKYLFLTKWDGKLPAVMGSSGTIVDVSSYLPTETK